MGQKVHPNGIRLGIVKPWNSTWFANTKEFADNLDSDFKVRQFLTKELAKASVSRIVIERPAKSIRVTIHTARPVSLSVRRRRRRKTAQGRSGYRWRTCTDQYRRSS